MKTSLGATPLPLQRQILMRTGLSAMAVAVGVGMLALTGNPVLVMPCLAVTLLAAVSAWRIYHLSALGRCLVLKGTVLTAEVSLLRHRPRALLLEVEGKALRVVLCGCRKVPGPGTLVEIYIADDTPLHEWRGVHQLQSYLALAAADASRLD